MSVGDVARILYANITTERATQRKDSFFLLYRFSLSISMHRFFDVYHCREGVLMRCIFILLLWMVKVVKMCELFGEHRCFQANPHRRRGQLRPGFWVSLGMVSLLVLSNEPIFEGMCGMTPRILSFFLESGIFGVKEWKVKVLSLSLSLTLSLFHFPTFPLFFRSMILQ